MPATTPSRETSAVASASDPGLSPMRQPALDSGGMPSATATEAFTSGAGQQQQPLSPRTGPQSIEERRKADEAEMAEYRRAQEKLDRDREWQKNRDEQLRADRKAQTQAAEDEREAKLKLIQEQGGKQCLWGGAGFLPRIRKPRFRRPLSFVSCAKLILLSPLFWASAVACT